MADPTAEPLLQIAGLRVRSAERPILDGVDLAVGRGAITGLIGASGAGKTTVGLAVLDLLPARLTRIGGSISVDGCALDDDALAALRGRRVGLAPQDPAAALNPMRSVGGQLAELVRLHHGAGRRAAREMTAVRLTEVGVPEPAELAGRRPHQLSGGQRQRVTLALALAGDPDVLIADEPATQLDPVLRIRTVDLLRRLADDRGLGVLLITHEIGLAARVADRVGVLNAGRIVENGPADRVLSEPRAGATRELLAASPRRDAPAA